MAATLGSDGARAVCEVVGETSELTRARGGVANEVLLMKHDCIRIGAIGMCLFVLTSGAIAAGPTTVAYHDSSAAILNKPDAWFGTDAGIKAVDAIVAAELPDGGWEKGYDTGAHAGKEWAN